MTRSSLFLAALIALSASAADKTAQPPAAPRPPHGLDMDYGPFLSYSLLKPGAGSVPDKKRDKDPAAPKEKKPEKPEFQPLPWKDGDLIAARGITVKLDHNSAICFDADTMRYAAGWTGGWVDLSHTHLANDKGLLPPAAVGTVAFTTPDQPGIYPMGAIDEGPECGGPMRKEIAHFRGIYRDGATTVFSYSVGTANVLDMPGVAGSDSNLVFTRTIRVEKSDTPITVHVCGEQAVLVGKGAGQQSLQVKDASAPATFVSSIQGEASFFVHARGVWATLPASSQPTQVTLAVATWRAGQMNDFAALLKSIKPIEDLSTHTHGGPALWPAPLETHGSLGPAKDAYTVDTVSLPEKNPWNAWMRLTALDFFKDGRCAVSTWSGDVWIVSGLDAKLDHVTWKRFATGLYDPLGLKIVNDEIYVCARDGIVKLHDLNNDGEADFYEYFGNDLPIGAQYNAFAMDLQSDSAGNFYYTVAGNGQFPIAPAQSAVVKFNKNGNYSEIFATGLRTANGMGIGPNDLITTADNQGNWVPSSPIWVVKPGSFLGYVYEPNRSSKAQKAEAAAKHPKLDYMPLCYIPYQWDNSAGSQVWASDKFGALSGHMLHTSYGKSSFFLVLPEQVEGIWQGAVIRMPLNFDSGIQRARVNPADGQVYVAGLHGWQTTGNRDGCLQRIRYTGKPVLLPTDLHVTDKGFKVTFPVELDPEAAKDEGGYDVEVWNYQWAEKYGSDDYKPSDGSKGHDPLEVKSVTLSPDKHTVFIATPGIQPVHQYVLKIRTNSADGATIKCDIGGTINKLAHEN